MLNHLAITLIFVAATSIASGQNPFHESYDWEETPDWRPLNDSLEKEGSVIRMNHVTYEYYYHPDYEDNLVEFKTYHNIIRVNSDDAIENNNKIYIGTSQTVEMIEAKARVVTPQGKVINFDEDNIKEAKEESSSLIYFALDGVVPGSDIEYMYTLLRVPEVNGSTWRFQSGVITKNSSFQLISPDNLYWEIKGYNGAPEAVKDTTVEDGNIYRVSIDSVPKLEDENYGAYGRSQIQIMYKLSYNSATGSSNITEYGTIAQRIFENYHTDIGKKSRKAVSKIVKASGASKIDDPEEKVLALENYIKREFAVIDGAPAQLPEDILENKYASRSGASLLFMMALTELDIDYEMVLTADRFDYIFDPDFDNHLVLQRMVLYLPDLGKYLAPSEMTLRLGFIPHELMATYGLFIRKMEVGDIVTGLGKVKYIEPLGHEESTDDLEIDVDLSEMHKPVVQFKRTMSGHNIGYIQSIYTAIEEDSRKEIDMTYTKFASSEGTLLEHEVSGVNEEDFGVNPMVFTGKIETPSLMEKARDNYLFKVGEVIGPQMEMYKDEERTMDIMNEFNHSYNRTITFKIPDGYEVSKLESIKMDYAYPQDDPTIVFRSDYTVDGNKVTITIEEYYDQIEFKKEEYEEFRKVINAAANFNKVVLIFKPS